MASTGNYSVSFFFEDQSVYLPNRSSLKKFIQSIFLKEGKGLVSLNYIFCTDYRLLAINKKYLKHNFYTDILTFDLSERNLGTIGEVYISIDRVRENALRLGEPIKKELHRVIFHGALHLCGYKDKTKREIATMRAKEDHYLKNYLK